jgi:2-dehydropantoate 2-reductase
MRIAVMGTGGVGGYYGGLLAKLDHEVTFIARGAHLRAIQEKGLQVKSIHGDFTVFPARVSDNPAEIGPVDLVIFCTKTYDTEKAAQKCLPLVGPETTVMSLQNGIDAAERIGAIIGKDHMLSSTTWISSAVEAPGVIKQVSQFRRVVLGEIKGGVTPRLQTIHNALQATGITAEISDNIAKVLWTKFVFISAASGFGSLTRLPIGDYRSIPETRSLITSLMREVEAIARAQGVMLDADVVGQSLDFIDNAAPHIRPSMQLDIEAGRRSEIESMIGVISNQGHAFGIPTPVADFIYATLLPVDLKARKA